MSTKRHFVSHWMFPVLGFAVFILVGALLLWLLPVHCAPEGRCSLPFVDALFMATSAACVTGLSVVDVGSSLSGYGQCVLLILIQGGGLGIMTISTGMSLLLGRGISMRSRFVLQDTFTAGAHRSFRALLTRIIVFTLALELGGMLLLFPSFAQRADTWWDGLWSAIFHAVSAFCNAGFSLYRDSLVSFRADVVVNLTVSALIVLGGLGFLVLDELAVGFRRPCSPYTLWRSLSLHSKVVLSTTALLIMAGFALFFIGERHTTMEGFSLRERILASLFQAITPRTAGFNTLDFASMTNLTILVTMILMFIGGSPGSTAGGIKISTLAVLAAVGIARFKKRERVHLFKRSLDEGAVVKAFGVFTVGIIIVITATALLLGTELGYKPCDATEGLFVKYLFEVISAFGTVGLSMGVTASLGIGAKVILICTMFVGRLGPFVVAMALMPSGGERGPFMYAEEKIMVG